MSLILLESLRKMKNLLLKLFRLEKPVVIHRDRLRTYISRQCGIQDFAPLDMSYKLVPSHRWLIGKTPIFPWWIKDCNKRVAFTKVKMLRYCVGECVVATDNSLIDHCLIICCMENRVIMLFDPSSLTLVHSSKYNIKRIWM